MKPAGDRTVARSEEAEPVLIQFYSPVSLTEAPISQPRETKEREDDEEEEEE